MTSKNSWKSFQKIYGHVKENVIETNVVRMGKEPGLSEHLLNISEEKDLKDVVSNIYDYQMYMLEYGLNKLREDVSFFEKILERETNK